MDFKDRSKWEQLYKFVLRGHNGMLLAHSVLLPWIQTKLS